MQTEAAFNRVATHHYTGPDQVSLQHGERIELLHLDFERMGESLIRTKAGNEFTVAQGDITPIPYIDLAAEELMRCPEEPTTPDTTPTPSSLEHIPTA